MVSYGTLLHEHFFSPRNAGVIEAPDAVGVAGTEGRAPFMVLQFRLADGVVVACKFRTFGCGHAIASGSVLTELVCGKTIDECLGLTADDVGRALGGMPADKRWCAELAVSALHDGLRQHRVRARIGYAGQIDTSSIRTNKEAMTAHIAGRE